MYGPQERGAHAMGGGRKKGGGWLKWLLLGLLAAALLALVIGLVSCGDDDEANTGNVATQAEGAADDAGEAAGEAADDAGNAAGGAAAGAGAGTLTAEGEDILPTDVAIDGRIDQQATGEAVTVQSVTESGFFVGTSAQDRRFIEWGGDVGEDEADQIFRPKVGDKVNLSGPVKEAPENPAQTLDLPEDEAALVSEQGAYVNADSVEPAS
jgi:hypothetical protein